MLYAMVLYLLALGLLQLASSPQVVQLAKKWKILTGKWLLSVPDWRIDVLGSHWC